MLNHFDVFNYISYMILSQILLYKKYFLFFYFFMIAIWCLTEWTKFEAFINL